MSRPTSRRTAVERMTDSLNRLCKWRAFYAGWQLGTRPSHDGPTKAIRDATDARLVSRAELNALTSLLIEHGVFTHEQWADRVAKAADTLSADLEADYPGFRVDPATGLLTMTADAVGTMQRLGFPQ